MTKATTEAWRHGAESGDGGIGKSGDREIGRRANSCYEAKIIHAAGICHPERIGVNATPSRRAPKKIIPEQAASGSSHEAAPPLQSAGLYQGTSFSRAVTGKSAWASVPLLFRSFMHIIRTMLSEIFDESAYDRFLLRTHASRSVASYRAFTRERDAAMVKKPRCC